MLVSAIADFKIYIYSHKKEQQHKKYKLKSTTKIPQAGLELDQMELWNHKFTYAVDSLGEQELAIEPE